MGMRRILWPKETRRCLHRTDDFCHNLLTFIIRIDSLTRWRNPLEDRSVNVKFPCPVRNPELSLLKSEISHTPSNLFEQIDKRKSRSADHIINCIMRRIATHAPNITSEILEPLGNLNIIGTPILPSPLKKHRTARGTCRLPNDHFRVVCVAKRSAQRHFSFNEFAQAIRRCNAISADNSYFHDQRSLIACFSDVVEMPSVRGRIIHFFPVSSHHLDSV